MSNDNRTLAQLAQEALNVQDACNLHGVVNGFSRSISRLRELLPNAGTQAISDHPICIAWADKIAHLTDIQDLGNSRTWKAYDALHEIVRAQAEADAMGAAG